MNEPSIAFYTANRVPDRLGTVNTLREPILSNTEVAKGCACPQCSLPQVITSGLFKSSYRPR